MTRDEILNMPAGREMDALIEHHIFGRTLCAQNEASYIRRLNGYEDLRRHKTYSTKMGEAWEVVRKFPDVHMEHSEKNDFAMIGDNFDTAVTCETMPLAICRAALLAMVTA